MRENHKQELCNTPVLDQFRPDVVECQHVWILGSIINKLGYPYICTAHHVDQMGFVSDQRTHPIALETARNAKYIFAISNFVKEEINSLYDIDQKKVIVIPLAYDHQIFRKIELGRKVVLSRWNLQIPEDAFIVSFVGGIAKIKGIDILLETAKLFSDENVHFLITGAGDLLDAKVDFPPQKVHFLGYQRPEVLSQIHNISKCSIFPSLSEGFCIAGLEAMGCGIPIIFTENGGMKEYAIGRSISPENPNALYSAIQEIIHLSFSEYSALSSQALKKAQEFSWSKTTARRLEYYKKLSLN